jgi:Tol biopolymer transport system component
VLASLNHPHIAAIYGLEESGGIEALVLELVEGDTLAERIARGPVPVDEALEIARQIARALEAAHEKGIVHRDLKPANVKLDPAGQVKVLDFGLAKALSSDSSSPDVTSSPTLTAAATQAGVVIGTAAYMSPEQARGKAVDRRADIWAFGTVLYEMLTGRKAFEGETVSDTLAAVLTKEPKWSALPAGTPSAVRRVLRRCLDRDARTRIHDVADARLELDEAPEPEVAPAAIASPGRRTSRLWALAALTLAAVAGWWLALRPGPAAAPRVTGFAVTLPTGEQIPFDDSPVLDLSRDGTRLVFVGDRDGHRKLYVRTRDRIEPKPVAGSEGAYGPFFSPDAQWIGFFADGKLKKIPAGGGVAMTLADAINNRGGVWLEDDTIVFAPHFSSGLSRIPARGGKIEVLTTPDGAAGERSHRWPTYLPGGGAVLFTIGLLKGPGNYDDARIAVWEPGTRKTRILFEGGTMARFAPPDHLVFWRAGTLLAAQFDAKRRRMDGEPVALDEQTSGDPSSGVAYAAVASDGTFAYVPGAETVGERRLILTDRTGKARPVPVPSRSYHYPRFSPDGKRIAVTIGPGHGNGDDVWICEIATGALSRLTFGDGNGNYYPVWSPDGKRVAFGSDRGHQGVFFKNADGSGEEEPLQPEARAQVPQDWSRDGSLLAITVGFPNSDVLAVSLRDRRETPFEPAASTPVFSPDGRWIAFSAQTSGASPQVVVKPLAQPGGKIQITSSWGTFPVWTDREIIYLLDNRKVVAVEARTTPTFHAGVVRELFDLTYDRGSGPLREYDVTRDGQTFVFVGGTGDDERKQIDVFVDWTSELARRLPGRK